ncbi:nucleoside-diphosphate sugar epimerase [Streptomyces sp. PRh5]|nr:nucleoside-diphosphate sugar epimerase [Streptomyces sp. PRh5]
MRVFVTGATGFVGAAVVRGLLDAGHQVLGLARSDASAATLTATGAEVHRGTLEDLDSLRAGAALADGVIHTAFIHDFTQFQNSVAVALRAIETIAQTLVRHGSPLCDQLRHPGRGGRDGDRGHHPRARDARCGARRCGGGGAGVRRPRRARLSGTAATVGARRGRPPRLRLPADRYCPGAGCVGKHLNLPVTSIPVEHAVEHFGWLGPIFAMDAPASSASTQKLMDWHPVRPGLLADLDAGHYFTG